MPELPWRRGRQPAAAAPSPPPRRQETTGGPAAPGRTDAGATDPGAADPRPGYTQRAVDCYLRAGDLGQAAHQLTRLGKHDRAAQLYLHAGDYQLAAQAYTDAGQPEAAAWIHVHNLDDTRTARAILAQNPSPQVPPLPTHAVDLWLATTSPWRLRFTGLSEKIKGLPQATADPAGGNPARDRLAALIAALLSDRADRANMTPPLAELRQLKLDAVAAQDWPAGYAARELERLLTDLDAAQQAERRRAEQRGREEFTRALAQRQVNARCDVADGAAEQRILPVLTQTQYVLADATVVQCPERTEAWGVAIAERMRRYDQAALIFAAAVRGQRPGAAARWRDWSARVLNSDAAIPSGAGMN